MTTLRGRVVVADRVLDDAVVTLEGERLGYVGPPRPADRATVALPDDVLLLPGLVDIHCHGGAGGEFGVDRAGCEQAAGHHHRAGTTSVVASLMTAPPERLVAGMRTCARLAERGVLAAVHTEGPFLAEERCGAQDPAALQDIDLDLVDALAEAGAGHWRMMTFAPELAGAKELLERLPALGVRPAVGHTVASSEQTRAALAAAAVGLGAPALVTHLFNGMPPFHHRRPGPAAAALAAAASGQAVVELVGDGIHVDDQTVAMAFDVAADGHVALITDAMAAAGMPEGAYSLGGQQVTVAGRTARLQHNGAIAGSVATLLEVVRRAVEHAQVPLARAVGAASLVPARALGLQDVGALTAGGYADVLAVTPDLLLLQVWRRGEALLHG